MENKEALKTMLKHIINDNTDEATSVMHDYFVNKTREVSGLSQENDNTPENDE